MFNNKYASISNLALLRKPRKRIVPKGPDLSNFITGNADLKKLANFGMEMMKFLPEFEQLIYAGEMMAEEGEGVPARRGSEEFNVTEEWWEAFNQYGIPVDELSEYGLTGLVDTNGDGLITNSESQPWLENIAWSTEWVAGQHHRVDRFGPFGSEDGSGFAGGGMGSRFQNLDFVAGASEWNHINRRGNGSPDSTAQAIGDQPYFLTMSEYSDFDFLGAMGISWDDIKAVLDDPALRGKSFYEIAMDGSYHAFDSDPRRAALLIAAMYESRERSWQAMTEIFGPVTSTQSDEVMKQYVDNFISGHNPYTNSHALALFPLFFYIQHSYQNQVTMFYYDRDKGDAYNLSKLDDARFTEFTDWAREQLQAYKGSLSASGQKDAVQQLYDKWFGAADPKSGRPMWAGRLSQVQIGDEVVNVEWWNTDSDRGEWVNIPDFTLPNGRLATEVWRPYVTYASYGWDRKWTDDPIKYKSGSSVFEAHWHNQPREEVRSWTALNNALYGAQSYLNPDGPAGHTNYTSSQFYGLNFNSVTMGAAFNGNWAVHAVGMFLRWGEGMDIVRVMEENAQKRVARVEYKQDLKDYKEKREELEYEKALDMRLAQRAIQNARSQLKKLERSSAQQRTSNNRANNNRQKVYYKGSKEYEMALQKQRQRILGASKKHRAWLQKTKKDNQ